MNVKSVPRHRGKRLLWACGCVIIKQLNRPTFDGMVKIFHGIKIKILNAPGFIITASRTSDAFTQLQSHEVHSIHAQPAMGRLSHRPPL